MTTSDHQPGAAQAQRPAPLALSIPDRLIITIDGPAGTGKSSTARQLAKRLGLDFLDTGAMYRAAAVLALDAGVNHTHAELVAEILQEADLHFDWTTDPPAILARDRSGNRMVDLTARIRSQSVDSLVSPLAGIAEVRRQMVRKQRLIGQQHPRLVTEGRDQGTVVFPDAEVKFFLWASPQVRANRRVEQLKRSNANPPPDEQAILQEIIRRDHSDSTRSVGPLVKPDDAIAVDSSEMSFEQVLDTLERLVRQRVAESVRAG